MHLPLPDLLSNAGIAVMLCQLLAGAAGGAGLPILATKVSVGDAEDSAVRTGEGGVLVLANDLFLWHGVDGGILIEEKKITMPFYQYKCGLTIDALVGHP